MRVLICHESDGAAQARQRAQTPAVGLTRLGVACSTSSFSLHPHREGGVIRGYDERAGRIMAPTEVVVLRLLDQDESASIRRARDKGQLVYLDLDDDVWQLPEWTEAWRWLKRDGRYLHTPPVELRRQPPRSTDLGALERNMAAATGVLVTTDALAESVRRHVPGVPVHVVRNAVDAGLYRWPRRPLEHTPLRVAWMGTTSAGHVQGLVDVADELRDVLEAHGAQLWHLGAQPGEPPLHELLGWPWAVPALEWRPNRDLPYMLAQVDVGLIARRAHPFHEAQSNVSGLAYMAAGCPLVASRTHEYALLTDLCYPEPWSLTDALGRVLSAPGERAAMRQRARRDVLAWSPEWMGRRLRDVFTADLEAAA